MKPSSPRQPVKRELLRLLTSWPWLASCASVVNARDSANGVDPQRRFRGIGIVLVVDAVPSAQMEGVVFYNNTGIEFYASSMVSKRNRAILALGGTYVPVTARVIWRDNPKAIRGENGGIDYEGTIIGDYTIPVAERIPNEVLSNIRSHGGALRLKFRLKPDGVLFGWDIERPGGGISKFNMPGGDFLETKY